VRSQYGHDFAVRALDGSDLRGAFDRARQIAFREQFKAASARDREGDAPTPDLRFAIRSEEQKHQIGGANTSLSRASLGMVAEPSIITVIRRTRH